MRGGGGTTSLTKPNNLTKKTVSCLRFTTDTEICQKYKLPKKCQINSHNERNNTRQCERIPVDPHFCKLAQTLPRRTTGYRGSDLSHSICFTNNGEVSIISSSQRMLRGRSCGKLIQASISNMIMQFIYSSYSYLMIRYLLVLDKHIINANGLSELQKKLTKIKQLSKSNNIKEQDKCEAVKQKSKMRNKVKNKEIKNNSLRRCSIMPGNTEILKVKFKLTSKSVLFRAGHLESGLQQKLQQREKFQNNHIQAKRRVSLFLRYIRNRVLAGIYTKVWMRNIEFFNKRKEMYHVRL